MPTPFEAGKNATTLGIDTTRLFVVVNPRISYCNTGDILKLVDDDWSICPYFKNLTSGKDHVVCLWERLAYADIVVHCPTQEDYDKLMKAYEEKTNWMWYQGQRPTDLNDWIAYKSETCVRYGNKFAYAHRQWYEANNFTIISLDTALEWLGVEKEPQSLPTTVTLESDTELAKMVNRELDNLRLSMLGWPPYSIGVDLGEEEPKQPSGVSYWGLNPNIPLLIKPKHSFMSDIATTLKNALLSKTDRILREHGLEDENGKITNEAGKLMVTELAEARWLERREDIAKVLLKEEGKK